MSDSPSPTLARKVWGALHPARLRAAVNGAIVRVRGGELTPGCVARSVAWGVFVGATPLFGLHTLLAVAPAFFFRLDPFISYLGSNVSMPPMIPILLYVETQVGSWLLHGETLPLGWKMLAPQHFLHVSSSLIVGSLVVASLLSAVCASCAFFVARAWLAKKPAVSPGSDP